MVNKKVTVEKIMSVIQPNEKVRVSDIASRLYIDNQKARRWLNKLVSYELLKMEKYHYVGNADICVYSKI